LTNSRSKGKRGELEACHFLNDLLGTQARRGQQFKGTPDSPDIVDAIPGVHIEVKRVEALNVSKAMEQAVRDSGRDIPSVLHRKNREKWMITIQAEDLIQFTRKIFEVLKGEDAKNN
jgi:hypothetical protein